MPGSQRLDGLVEPHDRREARGGRDGAAGSRSRWPAATALARSRPASPSVRRTARPGPRRVSSAGTADRAGRARSGGGSASNSFRSQSRALRGSSMATATRYFSRFCRVSCGRTAKVPSSHRDLGTAQDDQVLGAKVGGDQAAVERLSQPELAEQTRGPIARAARACEFVVILGGFSAR